MDQINSGYCFLLFLFFTWGIIKSPTCACFHFPADFRWSPHLDLLLYFGCADKIFIMQRWFLTMFYYEGRPGRRGSGIGSPLCCTAEVKGRLYAMSGGLLLWLHGSGAWPWGFLLRSPALYERRCVCVYIRVCMRTRHRHIHLWLLLTDTHV